MQIVEQDGVKLVIASDPEEVPEVDQQISFSVMVKNDKPVKLKIKEPIRIYLNMRRSLEGNYMIFDHPLYDVVIMPKKNKIVTFSKKDVTIDPYGYQDRLFDFFRRKGLIQADTIQGGSVFGSLEATYPINDKIDTMQAILLSLYSFLKGEARDMRSMLDYEHEIEDMYTDPDDEDSTQLGEVPQGKKKGSIDHSSQPYGLIYRI
tara:strand:+ start:6363 stop:6977 length:615 start_codon:yes stop_codon:yes gene_type:complete